MPRAAPIQTAFNNGETSPYLHGRVDLQKSALSLRECRNAIPLTQGPVAKRGGSRFVVPVCDETKPSWFFEFEFSTTQGYLIEMNGDWVRFFTNRGLVLEAAKAVTAVTQDDPAVVTSAGHGFANGDQVVFVDVGPYSEFANRPFIVANKTDDTFELSGFDGTGLPVFSGAPTVARVYRIACPYAAAALADVTYIESADVLYLFHEGYRTRHLVRNAATDWEFELHEFKDGPYLTEDVSGGTTLTPATTGHVTPIMTSNTAPSGIVTANTGETDAYLVFDKDRTTNYDTTAGQAGWIDYDFDGSTKVVDAYWVQATKNGAQVGRSPTSWALQGWTGAVWVILDERHGETGWSPGDRRYFAFANKTAFAKYRFEWFANDGGDTNSAQFAEVAMHQAGDTQTAFNLTASAVTGINDDQGFLASDVGRPIRLLGEDQQWRWAKIVARTSSTIVTIKLYGHALPGTTPIRRWRLGMYSDETGWPSCGAFYGDRLMLAAGGRYIVGSKSGIYDEFSPSEDEGTVVADSGFALPLIERQVNEVHWLEPTRKGLAIGTSGGEAVLQKATPTEPFSALNIEVAWPTDYGSKKVRPQRTPTSTLFVQRAGKRVREFAYVFAEDGFLAPDMSIMADHLLEPGIERSAYQAHPFSIYWAVRLDGSLLGMTYEREQNVIAWHLHSLGGNIVAVKDIAVIPSPDGTSEDLWVQVIRSIDGQTRRYIEYFGDPFSHSTAIEDAVFSDSALTYDGDPVSTISGLWHLEGETVRVLVDGSEVPQQAVSGGTITLSSPGSKVTVGLPYTMRLHTLPLEAGAADGTARGRMKRVFRLALRLYRALGGKYGTSDDQPFTPIQYRTIDQSVQIPLQPFSGEVGDLPNPSGWDRDGGLIIENNTAYPFTLIATMPRVDTENH
ncbi:MAG: hypothetical protein Q8P46_06980 [Hyphomicrobiales bacterium]|nr:hypothetical protein [Hyphomicrobiales bacterium]